MRHLLASAAILALLAGTSASAQDQNFDQGHQRGGSQRSTAPQSERGRSEFHTPQASDRDQQSNERSNWPAQFTPGENGHHGHERGNAQMGQSGPVMGPPPGAGNEGRGNRAHGPTTGGHANVDIRPLQKNVWSQQHFHAGAYNPPRGWYPHRWHYGEFLPRFFFIRDYWILDFFDVGLFAPPPGLVWVRVGSDALLIDEYTGEVVEVVYGVFY